MYLFIIKLSKYTNACPFFFLVVTPSPPPVTMPPTTYNASCSFEDSNLCGYTQVINDNLDWSRRQGWRFYYYYYYYYRYYYNYYYYSSWYRRYYYNRYRYRYATGPMTDHTLGTRAGNVVLPYLVCISY